MKKTFSSSFKTSLRLAVLGSALLLCQAAWAAVSFTVTPASVSNTYTGTITLQIGGLNNGETVQVDKYLDANANGVIDAGDWPVQSFRLTDGQAMVIGGVTNISVPGDTDAASGTITARLLATDILQKFVGTYLFTLSSPGGRFTPLTKSFTVTSTAYSQSVTGLVQSSGANIPNAGVVLLSAASGIVFAGTVADNAGGYALAAAPGSYQLWAFKSNYVFDTGSAPVVTLGAGMTITTNLNLLPATRSVSGRFVDAANTSLGLPGMFVNCKSTSNDFAVGFTDANGNFTVPVVAGQWTCKPNDRSAALLGYLNLSDWPTADTTAGNVSGLTIALPKGTALIFGSVLDNHGQPVPGVEVNAGENDWNGPYENRDYPDQNGYYAMAVTAGLWQPEVNTDNAAAANYVFSSMNDINISDGQAVRVDFVGVFGTNVITGYVKDANNKPVANVGVFANLTGVGYNANAQTDTNGYYSLNVVNGSWSVGVCCSGSDCLSGLGYPCVNNQTATISNNNAIVNFTLPPCGALQIQNSSPLPDGQVGVNLISQAQVSGCNPPFVWSLLSGSFPPGITFTSDGMVSGTPTAAGTFNFSVRVTDSMAATADKSFTWTIDPASQQTKIIGLSGSLAFGAVTNGTTKTAMLTISNTGNTTLTVSSIGYPNGFSGDWSGTIPAGGSHNVTVTFAPTAVASYGGTVTVASDATVGTGTIAASGTGVQPSACVDLTATFSGVVSKCKTKGTTTTCSIKGLLNVSNMGSVASPATAVWFYLSSDAVLDVPGDTLLQQVALKAINPPAVGKPAKPLKAKLSPKLPAGVNTSGQYIIAVIDPGNAFVKCAAMTTIVVFGPLP